MKTRKIIMRHKNIGIEEFVFSIINILLTHEYLMA